MADDLSTSQERTEPATGKKKEDARRKGSVAKSVELNSSFILIFGLMLLYFGGPTMASRIATFSRDMFSHSAQVSISPAEVHQIVLQGVVFLAATVLPLLIGLMLVGLVSSYAQVGVLFSLEPLEIKLNKLNPLTGIKKVFGSRRSMMELLKNLLKVCVVAFVAYLSVASVMAESLVLMEHGVEEILVFMVSASLGVGWKVGLAFLVLAVLDYFFQRYEYERELRMTKQEVKEEMKSMEGDPLIKGRIRKIQKQIAYRRMMHDVPKADVVIANPTHVAVALQYDGKKMSAPIVVAKGAEYLAQRIKQIAQECGVPIVEDKSLARAIYQAVDVGEQIPEKLFQAVAQVLAYIYKMKSKKPRFQMN